MFDSGCMGDPICAALIAISGEHPIHGVLSDEDQKKWAVAAGMTVGGTAVAGAVIFGGNLRLPFGKVAANKPNFVLGSGGVPPSSKIVEGTFQAATIIELPNGTKIPTGSIVIVSPGGNALSYTTPGGQKVTMTYSSAMSGKLPFIQGQNPNTYIPPPNNGQYVNVVSANDTRHILYGERKADGTFGGGHMYPGNPGKTRFPQSWDADKIMHEISDIVTSPNTRWYAQTGTGGIHTKAGDNARWIAWEVRDGVRMRIIYEPASGRVVTGFPDSNLNHSYKPIP